MDSISDLQEENERLKTRLKSAIKCIKALNEIKINIKRVLDTKNEDLFEEEFKILFNQLVDNCDQVLDENKDSLELNIGTIDGSAQSETPIDDNANVVGEEPIENDSETIIDLTDDDDLLEPIETIIPKRCPIVGCDSQCGFDYDMVRFAKTHTIIIKCPIDNCGKAFTKSEYLVNHLRDCHNIRQPIDSYLCPQCNKSFSNYGLLNVHFRSEHKSDDNDETINMKAQQTINQDRKRKSVQSQLEPNKTVKAQNIGTKDPKQPSVKCCFIGCNRQFSEYWRLNQHIAEHNRASLFAELKRTSLSSPQVMSVIRVVNGVTYTTPIKLIQCSTVLKNQSVANKMPKAIIKP